MDVLISIAARALAMGDPLGALNRVALRDDAPALALRGIAMAQLGDLVRARTLVRDAAIAFGREAPLARARCIVAEAEIALASRDLGWSQKALEDARVTLEMYGDAVNAAHARQLEIRRLLLIGCVAEAEALITELDPAPLPPPLRAVHDLIVAGIAIRRVQADKARAAVQRARSAARASGVAGLLAEVESMARLLDAPAARLVAQGDTRTLSLGDVEKLLATNAVVMDGVRNAVLHKATMVSLARRPVLFALARMLGEVWPEARSRDELLARVFRARRTDESYRARLRVEIGRLRKALFPIAEVRATGGGFVLVPRHAQHVAVLAAPVDEPHGAVLALLADGQAWSSSALALALGASQRTVQRALDTLACADKVQSLGRGRALRWAMPPRPGFATVFLLTPALGEE